MTLDFARKASTILLALLSTSTFASHLHKGFYVGANTGVAYIDGDHYTKLIDAQSDPQIAADFAPVVFRDDAGARGFSGSLLAGWNFFCDRGLIVGIELSGDIFSNRGRFTENLQTPLHKINYEENFNLNYAVNTTLQPGWLINDSSALYAIVGYSYGRMDSEAKNLYLPSAGDSVLQSKHGDAVHGFVLGAGIKRQFAKYVYVFASYQYTHYGRTGLADVTGGAGKAFSPFMFKDRSITLDSSVFKLGMAVTFD